MAKKIEIIGSALVVTDTVSGLVEVSQPAKDAWYNEDYLKTDVIKFENIRFISETTEADIYEVIPMADAVNSSLVAFTESTFRTFCTLSLGNAGSSGLSSSSNETSVVNSTTTLLTNGSVFTGEWENVSSKDSLVVAVKTDQNGTYSVQFSPDGINQDSTLTRYYRTDQIEAPHRFTVTRNYARIVFTNDSGSDQTYLRLQTSYGTKADLNAPLDSTLSQDFDAIAVRPSDYKYEVAGGLRQGSSIWNKWGYNDDIDIGTEVIASWGGTFTPLTTATTLIISSGSVNDTSGGTGCNSIVVYGVDANRDEQIEVITMNGTTSVVTVSTWLGINRVAMFLCGTSQGNEGEINVIATTGGSTMAQMPLGGGEG